MEIETLRALVKSQEELGLSLLVLAMPAPKSWVRRGHPAREVRTPFGMVRCYANNTGLTIMPTLDQVKAYLKKVDNTKLWVIVTDSEKLTAEILPLKYKELSRYDGHPTQTAVKHFLDYEEAARCLAWAAKEAGIT
jgi:hypothetical protein